MPQPLTIVAKLVAKPGQEATLERELTRLLAPTRAEEGCLLYDLHRSIEDPAVFLFYETWESMAAWQAHMKTPHLTAMAATTAELIAEREILQMERFP
jgi:quinol monooxygenase YgiN